MMKISSLATATAIAALLLMGSASAQTAAPAKTEAPKAETKADTKAPAEKKAAKPQTAASLECSKEADAKGLHGKERKKFRSECKKTAGDKAGAAK
jgi:phosphate-selective porin